METLSSIPYVASTGVHAWQAYVTLAIGSQGNQVHEWAHLSDRAASVRWLQSLGIMQSRSHRKHHASPYAVRFCALSDDLDPVLDGIGFRRGLERAAVTFGATVRRGSVARGGY
jgi:hypothetical protein